MREWADLEIKQMTLSKIYTVNVCHYSWFVQKRNSVFPISATALQLQAEKFHKDPKTG